MGWFQQIFRRGRIYDDLSEELRQHLEEKTDQLMRTQGMGRREAEQAARRAFGNVTLTQERSREVWQWPRLESFSADIRFAFRQLRKAPGFAVTAVLTLAIGIGANTAVFSVMNAILLRPLAFPHPERIFQMEIRTPGGINYDTSIPMFLEWRDHSRAFQHVAAYLALPVGFNVSEKGRPERIPGLRVSADFFRVLGVEPQLGRYFSAGEDRIGAQRVVILSDTLWQRRYAADPNIVGRTISIDGQAATVIGILPHGFQFLAAIPASGAVEIWSALQLPDASHDPSTTLQSIARLKDGVTSQQAGDESTRLSHEIALQVPALFPKDGRINMQPLQQRIAGDTRPTLLLLLGAVLFILLIACANFANLLVARMGQRSREIAVRTALGARSLRVIRQLLTESILLSLLGGAAGLLVAVFATRLLTTIAPLAIVRLGSARIDWRVLLFTLSCSLLCGMVFGLLPALRVQSSAPLESLRSGSSRSATQGRSYRRMSGALVVGETALSLMLLIVAGLLLESFVKISEVNLGFDHNHLLTFETSLPAAKYKDPALFERFLRETAERIAAIPGVESASGATSLPTEPTINMPFTRDDGLATSPDEASGESDYIAVGADYFRAMSIPVLQGRSLAITDTADAPGVVVINHSMAQKFWPNQNPIGKRITIARNLGPDWVDRPRQIVGVVADAKADLIEEDAPPIMYTPFAQLPAHFVSVIVNAIPINWAVRSRMSAASLTQLMQAQVASVDGDEPIAEVRPMADLLATALLRWRFNMLLLGVFAGIALLLAAIGLHGVISYTVSERTSEIGVRMALGAGRASVVVLVMRQAGVLIGLGVIAGLGGVMLIGRILKGFLYGVTTADATILASVTALMLAVGALAAWRPAYRAASVDPVRALRSE